MKPRVRLKTKKSLRQTKASHKITDRGNQKKREQKGLQKIQQTLIGEGMGGCI